MINAQFECAFDSNNFLCLHCVTLVKSNSINVESWLVGLEINRA